MQLETIVNDAASFRAREGQGHFKMRFSWRAIILALAFSSLSACAHKDLTAPCEAGSSFFGWLDGSANAFACGPMRPVNSEGDNGLR
jgi:hypothetical protein